MTRRVHFSEVDRAGVLYFAHYYRFMEETEHAFRKSIGLQVFSEVDGRETTWPRVATSCEYYSPALFDEILELTFRVVKVGNRSVTYEVDFDCEGRSVALGRMTAVYCILINHSFEVAAIPDYIRKKLEGAMATS